MTKIFVAGGAGFIGSNFIRYWLSKYPDDLVINYDLLTYAGNFDNLTDMAEKHRDRYVSSSKDVAITVLFSHIGQL